MSRPPLEVADIFRRYGETFQAGLATPLTALQRRVMSAVELCRTAALGGQVEQCDRCGHRRLCYRSCRNRHCPKCQWSARAEWLDRRRDELLDCEYHHVVFTLPGEFAAMALQNKRVLFGIPFRAASRTLREIAGDPCWLACKTAQSWASKMAHLRAGAGRGFWAGLAAGRWEDQGILASSLNEGGAMFDSDKRVLVRHYLDEGVAKAEIAHRLKIGRRTVYNWIAGGKLGKEACEGKYGPRPSRPSKLDGFKEIIAVRLAVYPQLSAVRLFDEVKAAGYTGGYDQVKRHVREVRPREAEEPLVRFETAPAHQAQVDFAEFGLPWGKRHALLVVLGYSRRMWLRFYRQQTLMVVIRGLEESFPYLGGVPAELLLDQMKAVVIADRRDVDGGLIENPEFRGFSDHWGFKIRACRPYRARTQGKVERPVRYLRGNFCYGREFVSDDDLNAQARHWLDEVANVRVHGTLQERVSDRFARERPLLGPLAPRPYTPVVPRDEPQQDPQRAQRALSGIAVERRPLSAYALGEEVCS